jgi:hypothetical protein
MSDKVRIVHPNHPGQVGEVTRGAYERRSKGLGWVLADEQVSVTEADIAEAWNRAAAPSEADLNTQLDERDRLRRTLTERGVAGWDGRTGVKKLRQLTEESNG